MPNILSIAYRQQILAETQSDENKRRKNDSLRQLEIYESRIARFVREKLLTDFSATTVNDMRTITSINITKRLVDNQASVYRKEPNRTFLKRSGDPLPLTDIEQLENLYEFGEVNLLMKKMNRIFRLHSQGAIQVVPKNGVIQPRCLRPHHYDVIPFEDDPSKAYAYLISVYDKSLLFNQTNLQSGPAGVYSNYLSQSDSDGINQSIGDADDEKIKQRFIWWTAEWNFITNGDGVIIDEAGNPIDIQFKEQLEMLKNPVEKLPFVDVAGSKDFEFWIRNGDDTVQFNIDFLVMLSDLAEIMKRQGYSQAIIYSEKPPTNMLVGPNRVLHIPLDANKEIQPRFEWSSPSPDLSSSLKILETMMNLFLTAQGEDPKIVSGTGVAQQFTSALDRFLSMIQDAEASEDDFGVFEIAEQKLCGLMVAWSNLMQGATVKGGVDPLIPELRKSTLPIDTVVDVEFASPEMVETKTDIENSVLRRLELGLVSRKRALMEIEGVDEATALEMMKEIDVELTMPGKPVDNSVESVDDPDIPDESAGSDDKPVAATGDESVQKVALNGAQVSSLVEIVSKVAVGLLPRAAAVELIQAAFPFVDASMAEKIIGDAGRGFKPELENANVVNQQ